MSPAAAFVAPLPIQYDVPPRLNRTSRRSQRRPVRFSRRQARASAAPSAPARATNPLTAPPQVVPYPTPAGKAGERAAFVSQCTSIPGVFRAMATDPDFATQLALVDEHHPGDQRLTFSELGDRVDRMAAGLSRLGLGSGEVVSFFSENSHRWLIADLAIMTVGAAAAVRGVLAPVPELCYIYEHSGSSALFVEDVSVLDRIIAAGIDRSSVKFVVVLFGSVDSYRDAELPVYSYEDVLERGARPTSTEVTPSAGRTSVATLLYTSGTTGHPKGVVLTHGNILSQLADISLGRLDPVPEEVFVSVLPCWHVFERTAAYWCLSKGVILVYSNKRRFRDDLAKHKPHLLISVPRVFENLHGAITAKLEAASALRRALFATFMTISLAYIKARRRIRKLDIISGKGDGILNKLRDFVQFVCLMPLYFLADKLIWTKIRLGTGGRLRMCLSGGGSIAGYLEDFFECAGIDICVGYGLTETSPVIANRFGEHNVRGSTGMTLPRAYVKIINGNTGLPVAKGEQGTLFIRGPYVFSEYLKNPEATAKAFDPEGYFDTGDLAYYADGGDVVMTGRSKDVIVLSNGENVEPAPIEDALLASPLIDQVMLVGQDEKTLGALVVPKLEYLEREGLIEHSLLSRIQELQQAPDENSTQLRKCEAELKGNTRLLNTFAHEIKTRNQERLYFSPVDNITHVRIILVPFTVENGMMTQTLKIKKNIVADIYAEEIRQMYRG